MKLLILLTFSLCTSLNANAYIINGQAATNDELENVVKLGVTYTGGIKTHCTATVIGSKTILTAGHCLEYYMANPDFKNITLNEQSFTIKKFVTPPGFNERYKRFLELFKKAKDVNFSPNKDVTEEYTKSHLDLASYDLAIINTNERLHFIRTKLSFRPVSIATQVVIAGYGYTKYSYTKDKGWSYKTNDGLYYGYNSISNNTLYYSIDGKLIGGKSDSALTAPGDSGSPLLLKDSLKQVGVLRGSTEQEGIDSSIFVPILPWKKFIKQNTN